MGKNVIIAVIAAVIGGGVVFFGFHKLEQKKLAWVNITKVYAEFEFKKELEAKLIKTQEARKIVIDSLEMDLKLLSRQIQEEKQEDKDKISLFEIKREDYYSKKDEFETNNNVLQQRYNEQILTQLNQYIKDYGKERKYKYVFGADGSGSLMYADDADDITLEVIKYINEKYKGKVK